MQRSKQLQEKIEHKRVELQHLTQIKEYTEMVTNQLAHLEDQLDDIVDGTESVGLVLSTWQTVIRSISLASIGLHKYSQGDYESLDPMPEPLVRIKLDKDNDDESPEDEDELVDEVVGDDEEAQDLEDVHDAL